MFKIAQNWQGEKEARLKQLIIISIKFPKSHFITALVLHDNQELILISPISRHYH